jgi:hypothetical protein
MTAPLFAALALFAAATPSAAPNPDPNGDGKVTLAEFQAWARAVIQRLDTNRDGVVSSAEWAIGASQLPGALGTRGYPSTGQVGIPPAFSQIDTDGDLKLSTAEIDAMSRDRFDAFDGNRDGALTGAEQDAVRASLQARR